jgi:hypothetical protein
MTLERIETKRGHKYKLDGRDVQGVTTILNAGMPKPALVNWAARTVAEYVADNLDAVRSLADLGRDPMVAALKATPWQDRDRAAARGTEVHALAEEIINGREVEVPGHIAGHVDGYVRWLDAWDVQPVVTERPCANRDWWYAGTFDAVVEFGRGPLARQRYLCDWKTSKGVYGETALQLAAYANAEFYLNEDGDEVAMPDVDGLAVLHVTATGSHFYEVEHMIYAWDAFQRVKWVSDNMKVIQRQITEPTPLGAML